MTTYRENLIDRMIRIYGYEHVCVLMFCELCQCWPEGEVWDHDLLTIVESHEENPYFPDED